MPRRKADYFGVPTLWNQAEGDIRGVALARRLGTLRGQRPHACTDATRLGTGRSHLCLWPQGEQTASGSRKAYADDERKWEVGPLGST